MQSSASNTSGYERLNRVDQLLRLQNATTQLELLIRKVRELEAVAKFRQESQAKNRETGTSFQNVQ